MVPALPSPRHVYPLFGGNLGGSVPGNIKTLIKNSKRVTILNISERQLPRYKVGRETVFILVLLSQGLYKLQ